jgi:two-component system sensor histidine kinase DesK
LFALLGTGVIWQTADGTFQPSWLSWAGYAAVCAGYAAVVLASFGRRAVPSRLALAVLAAVVLAMAVRFGDGWYYLFPLVGIACGLSLRGRPIRPAMAALTLVSGLVVWTGGGDIESTLAVAWGTFSSGLVVAVILHLHIVIGELRETRQRLAEAAVAEERLRFARDLHDLLGHTLSVVVVKAEAVQRLARRDPGQAERQAGDIETIGRQALAEVREAVTGYRAGSLAEELARAGDALEAAGVEVSVSRTGPPPGARAETLLSWVVREGVTNIIRHSGATRAEIDLAGPVLTIRDNGTATGTGTGTGGSGLRGLTERLAQVGGRIDAGPREQGGFELAATLPDPGDAR